MFTHFLFVEIYTLFKLMRQCIIIHFQLNTANQVIPKMKSTMYCAVCNEQNFNSLQKYNSYKNTDCIFSATDSLLHAYCIKIFITLNPVTPHVVIN